MSFPQRKLYTEEDYYNTPENARVELIYGRLYNHASPSRQHQRILSELHIVIGNYIKRKQGSCHVYPAPFAVKLFADKGTVVEPDISVICDKSKLTDRGCTGAPDWVIEIVSPGNPSHDYILKLKLYAEAGVREYWIVNPMNGTVFVYYLEENAFEAVPYTFQDKIKANIYEDLTIDFSELDL